ncbi:MULTISPECIES: DUF6177 family protein [unclassified Frigoribacterium]|uniref:DUF6177 family protein n=1 Tax=unclassified Frigoribacterium TaxID=2627005 RepID=UPI0015638434|nr:hypothetical protein [Frigoribacterium sp. VKM Ac-2860]NQX09607.1 hypothetical protein [Frigoribacterium sp. VKM Ac-2859]
MSDSRATTLPHPLADASGPGWIATISTAPVVGLTSGRQALLTDATRSGVRVVVVTHDDARLSWALYQALRLVAGAWLVRDADGHLRHAVGGARVASYDEALLDPLGDPVDGSARATAPADEFALLPQPAVETTRPWLQFSVAVHHAARAEALTGTTTEALVTAVAGVAPTVWGTSEPPATVWDRGRITALARARMPRDSRVHVAGSAPDGTVWTGTIRIARSETGLTEETRLLFALPEATGVDDATRASSALRSLSEKQQVLLATAWSLRGAADATITPYRPTTPQPLAAVVGARAVRRLGLDAASFAAEHGGTTTGNARTPSLVVPFGADATRWQRFAAALDAIGPGVVADALLPPAVRRAP